MDGKFAAKTRKQFHTMESIRKGTLALLLLASTCCTVHSQTEEAQPYQDFSKHPRVYTPRYSFWFEGNINGTLKRFESGKPKWQYQIDYQYRRNSDASYIKNGEHYNIFKDMTASIIRPWIHYWAIPGKLRVSVSPIGNWASWTPRAEGDLKFFHEFRSTYQATLYDKVGKLEIQQRYRFEFRWVSAKVDANRSFNDIFTPLSFNSGSFRTRLRYNLRGNYPLGEKTYVSVWDELFLGLGHNSSNSKLLDQNRLVALYGIKFNQDRYPMKLELGVTWQVQPKYDMDVPVTQDISYGTFAHRNVESNLALQIYLIFDEFHRFRKNKKAE